jgi:hypothetical protein
MGAVFTGIETVVIVGGLFVGGLLTLRFYQYMFTPEGYTPGMGPLSRCVINETCRGTDAALNAEAEGKPKSWFDDKKKRNFRP